MRTMATFMMLALTLVAIGMLVGCTKLAQNKADDTVISMEAYNSLPADQKSNYTFVYKMSEKTTKVVDTAGNVIETTTPIVASFADIFWPGVGTFILGVGGALTALWKKWRNPLVEAKLQLNSVKSFCEAISTGSLILYDVIEQVKEKFPDTWTFMKSKLPTQEKSAEAKVVMPDNVAVAEYADSAVAKVLTS